MSGRPPVVGGPGGGWLALDHGNGLLKLPTVTRDIRSLSRDELLRQFEAWGQPRYRADQLLQWLYGRRVVDWDSMTDLPKALRAKLRACFTLHLPELVQCQGSADTTQKFLWRLADGALIESVLVPASPALYGQASDRLTLCVSTQVGCAYRCRFCASGLRGWKRNLRVEEIVGQVLAAERYLAEQARAAADLEGPAGQQPSAAAAPSAHRQIDNLVIMGMGEPLANYEAVLQALRILNAPWGGGIGARKITLSTSGLAPQIRRLADEPEQFRLAVSLHATTDELRSRLMPINRKYALSELIAACQYYRNKKGRVLSLEYVLIAELNDAPQQARQLAALARPLQAKVNLIPYNPVEGLRWRRPEPAVQEAFLAVLRRHKVPATLRQEKGTDIDAACGQLRLKTERVLRALNPAAPEAADTATAASSDQGKTTTR